MSEGMKTEKHTQPHLGAGCLMHKEFVYVSEFWVEEHFGHWLTSCNVAGLIDGL